MNKTGLYFLTFAFGASIGSLITWRVLKNKYEDEKRNDNYEMRKYYQEKYGVIKETAEEETKAEEPIEEPQRFVQKSMLDERVHRYSGGFNSLSINHPYIISPDEFGELDDYEQITLIHYSDGVLADETDEVVEDVEKTVGTDYVNHFGEYEDDVVFVRNDERFCDYEICYDTRKWSELEN